VQKRVKVAAAWGLGVVLALGGAGALKAQSCSQCAVWNAPQTPFKVYGNTYYVGPHGLSSVLITSDQGDVLIDGDTQWTVPQIVASIRALGFRIEDVKLIVNSHVHFDHAGGIAELQRLSGARVVASPWSAEVLRTGGVGKDDPQYGEVSAIPKVARVSTLQDGETLHVGPIAITAHFTPGHTPGGTSWTWKSCEDGKCLDMVYADSVSAVSRDGYKFSAHPEMILGFAKSFEFLETVPCDVLITAHPDASDLLGRREKGNVVDAGACKRLAEVGKDGLKDRLVREAGR